jgi:hypothetical protein
MKNRLEKKEGKDLKQMKVGEVIDEMEKEVYENIIRGAYEREEKREYAERNISNKENNISYFKQNMKLFSQSVHKLR